MFVYCAILSRRSSLAYRWDLVGARIVRRYFEEMAGTFGADSTVMLVGVHRDAAGAIPALRRA